MSKKHLNKIIQHLYKVWLTRGCKMCKDDDWSNVHNLIGLLKMSPSVRSLSYSSGKYHNYLGNDRNTPPYRDYDVDIETEFGKIEGYVRCCAAGSQDNPFSTYDIVVSFWPSETEVNESLVLNESFSMNFGALRNELKAAKDVNDILAIGKKYVKELALIGTFLTFALAYTDTSEYEFLTLSNDLTNYIIESCEDNEISWSLVSDNVEATVYNAVESQCNKDVKHTASMFELDLSDPASHRIIAMERSMMTKYGFKYGDIVKIEGAGNKDGVYQIQDTMNKKFAGKDKIDILVNNEEKHGKWSGVSIYRLNDQLIHAYDIKDELFAPAKNLSYIDSKQS